MRRFFLKQSFFIFCMVFGLVTMSFATKFSAPPSHKIFSENKQYYIDFHPYHSELKVMRIIKGKSERVWTFLYPGEMEDLFVSNDGKHAFAVHSKYVKATDLKKPAVLIFTNKGLVKHYSYESLSTPRKYTAKEVGPIGDFWRVWREGVRIKNGYLLIHTTSGIKRIDMSNGRLI